MMKKRLLILCTGNSCRSQMAEGIARKLYGGSWDVFSAGTHPSSVNPYAIRAMDELNIDISTHTSDSVNYYLDENIDLIITVCDHAASNCPIFPGKTETRHWPFEDPFNAVGDDDDIMSAFRVVRDKIHDRFNAEF